MASQCMIRTFEFMRAVKRRSILVLQPDQDLPGHDDFNDNQLIGINNRDL